MQRLAIGALYGVIGLIVAIGLTFGAYALAGKDLAEPAKPVGAGGALAPEQTIGASPTQPGPDPEAQEQRQRERQRQRAHERRAERRAMQRRTQRAQELRATDDLGGSGSDDPADGTSGSDDHGGDSSGSDDSGSDDSGSDD